MKERQGQSTLDFTGGSKKYLLPRNYSRTVEERADAIQAKYGDLLTRIEAGALAISEILAARESRLGKNIDLENRRVGPMMELKWTMEQGERVKESDSFQSAAAKLREESAAIPF